MLGPLLPALIDHWHIRDVQAGTLFTADFLGQLLGSWFAARYLKASILYGSALTAAGCIALTRLQFGPAHIALFAIGIGIGAGLTAGNIIAGTAIPESRTRLITLLNVAWGLGAIACPLLVRLTAAGGMERFLWVATACLAASTVVSFALPGRRQPSPPVVRQKKTATSRLPLPLLPLFFFAAAMLLYVGVENALGGWLPSYATRSNPSLHASSISLLFWIAELGGRLLLIVLMSRITERSLYRLCLVLLISAEVLLCLVAHPSILNVTLLTILSALTLAPIYPLIISFLLERTGEHARLGVLFAFACCGGAFLPWLTGVFSTYFHGLRAGLTVPATGAVLLLAISSVITESTTERKKKEAR
jgi:fucose permease